MTANGLVDDVSRPGQPPRWVFGCTVYWVYVSSLSSLTATSCSTDSIGMLWTLRRAQCTSVLLLEHVPEGPLVDEGPRLACLCFGHRQSGTDDSGGIRLPHHQLRQSVVLDGTCEVREAPNFLPGKRSMLRVCSSTLLPIMLMTAILSLGVQSFFIMRIWRCECFQ